MEFRKIISGEDKSPAAALGRLLFYFLSFFYYLAVEFRNLLYDIKWLRSHELPVPVISVGNITAGGTGKTPFVIWLCEFLQREGFKPAVLTRGYKGKEGQGNDETLLMQRALPNVPIVVNSDRFAGGKTAIREHRADILVLDDGFQHRRLKRDCDIILIDVTCPLGYGRLLPRGLLREESCHIRRAQLVVFTRCEQASRNQMKEAESCVFNAVSGGVFDRNLQKQIKVNIPGCYSTGFEPSGFWNSEDESPKEIAHTKSFLFCGIGNPQAFVKTVEQSGGEVIGRQYFPDHYEYASADIEKLAKQAEKAGATWLVTTEKDWVKIEQLNLPKEIRRKILWVKIELQIIDNEQGLGEKDLKEAILNLCRNAKPDSMTPLT